MLDETAAIVVVGDVVEPVVEVVVDNVAAVVVAALEQEEVVVDIVAAVAVVDVDIVQVPVQEVVGTSYCNVVVVVAEPEEVEVEEHNTHSLEVVVEATKAIEMLEKLLLWVQEVAGDDDSWEEEVQEKERFLRGHLMQDCYYYSSAVVVDPASHNFLARTHSFERESTENLLSDTLSFSQRQIGRICASLPQWGLVCLH